MLRDQAIKRAKLVGSIYYSEDIESIRIFHEMIDRLDLSSQQFATGDEHIDGTYTIKILARFLVELDIGRCVINDLSDRKKFFVDVLYEKYHPENLNRRIIEMNYQDLIHPQDPFFDDA